MTTVIERLIQKGVRIPNPQAVEIGKDVDPNQISAHNVTIHTGCKLYGDQTWIVGGCYPGQRGTCHSDQLPNRPPGRAQGGLF